MENQNEHIRHVLLHYFHKGKTAVQNCFSKFPSGDFRLKDAPRSGRPVEVDGDKITALIESDPRMTTREIAETLEISKSSVENH
jgi:histone-lysine N-methyltransferase SETMAR